MGGTASCLGPPGPPPSPPAGRIASDSLRLTFAYASRPGTAHAASPTSSSLSSKKKAFAAQRQPLKANQDACLVRPSYGGLPFLHLFAVFDGHGPEGAKAAGFARDRMEALLLEELRARSGDTRLTERVAGLSTEAVTAAIRSAFLATERAVGRSLEVDDSFSGTTAVVVLLVGCRLFAASVGDSRAVLGVRGTSNPGTGGVVAVDVLTRDHNPYRANELARIERAGGVVLSYEQMAAIGTAGQDAALASPSWQRQAGGDSGGDALPSFDPPRVWDKALTKPGCCFTRSLGDSFAKTLGVIAEPEVEARELRGAFVLCLGSDGVFEFIDNESLLALVATHQGRPLDACRSICARSVLLSPPPGKQETPAQRERRELLYHHRDDTTLICVHIQTQKNELQPK